MTSPAFRDSTTQLLAPSTHGWSSATVQVLDASASPSERAFSRGSILIGAGLGADVVIDDASVSRRHLQLSLLAEGLEVVDLGSRNGTYFQGQRISRLLLERGATLRLGNVQLRVQPTARAALEAAPEAASFGNVLGRCDAMRKVFGMLHRLKGSAVPLLLEGESGTGKDVVARAVHAESSVAAGPFVAVNCGAIDRALARSELFGHRRGAFTGAVEARAGAFELAHGGTLFLDEIGELPLDVQPLLLRALETERVVRIGEAEERPVRVRLVAATHRDLFADVQAQRFRADLYYRLNVVRIALPPLRERRDDIELLARHFGQELGIQELGAELLGVLCSHHWPGNVRELRNVLRGYAAVGALSLNGNKPEQLPYAELLRRTLDLAQPYHQQKERLLSEFADAYLQLLLTHTGGNQSEAARIAGLDRAHLNKMVSRFKRGL
jgi:DNA-binding NtrC family response regulator